MAPYEHRDVDVASTDGRPAHVAGRAAAPDPDCRHDARGLGFDVRGVIESPVTGAEGNVEFLMHGELRIKNFEFRMKN